MKKYISLILLTLISLPLIAFDWPQEETESDMFYSYYGQLRGDQISSSLIFTDPSEVNACQDGQIAVILTEHDDGMGWFNSTLGNCIIISHSDNLNTVYGNLENSSIPEELSTKQKAEKKEILGYSANSGWQKSQSCLEFQVYDTKNNTSVNPRILLPRKGKELSLHCTNLTLIDKEGTEWELSKTRKIPSGNYKIYKDRQEVAVPFKTLVAINGVTNETISYETLSQVERKLCIHGNDFYSKEVFYPANDKQLLGKVLFTKGYNSLSITLVNILGITQTFTYNLEIY